MLLSKKQGDKGMYINHLCCALVFITSSMCVQAAEQTVAPQQTTVSSTQATPDNKLLKETAVQPQTKHASASEAESTTPLLAGEQQITPPSAPLVTHDMSVMGMYNNADWVVKTIMISLLLASVFTWGIFIAKLAQLRIAMRRCRGLLLTLGQASGFSSLTQIGDLSAGNELMLQQAMAHEMQLAVAEKNVCEEGIKERVQLRLQRIQAELGRNMSAYTGILASVGSIGPFIGLFGTVWGIMNAFIGIAKAQNTSLGVVAPGIAEALLATALGLVAAIPAVVMYNFFTRGIAHYRAQLEDIAVALMILLSRDLQRPASEQQSSTVAAAPVLKQVG